MKQTIVKFIDAVAVICVGVLLPVGLIAGGMMNGMSGALIGLIIAFLISVLFFGLLFVGLEAAENLREIRKVLERQQRRSS